MKEGPTVCPDVDLDIMEVRSRQTPALAWACSGGAMLYETGL